MMWIRKELVTVFALVLVTVRATELCDVTKVSTFNVSALTGTMYLALSTADDSSEGYGAILTPTTRNGAPGLKMESYALHKLGSDMDCFPDELLCEVKDNGCQTSDMLMYIIAYDKKYVVMYTRYLNYISRPMELEVYIRGFDWTRRLFFDDLPLDLRDKVKQTCGQTATQSGFYPKHYEPRHFIPKYCL